MNSRVARRVPVLVRSHVYAKTSFDLARFFREPEGPVHFFPHIFCYAKCVVQLLEENAWYKFP